jgi:hypothetical protein
MLKNLSKPLQYALIAVLAVAAWLTLSPVLFPESAPKVVKKTPKPKLGKNSAQIYTEEDLTARFDPVNAPLKNVFKPLIAKTVTSKTGGAQLNIIPPAFAGGEQNWTYTGSAEIDGVLQALLENKVTGDNVFLKVGDTWKGISVEEITDDTLVLASPFSLIDKRLELPAEDVVAVGGPGNFAPVNPPLQGSIGPLSVQPDGTAQPDMSGIYGGNGNGNGGRRNGGRRGGRRNSGGANFGG